VLQTETDLDSRRARRFTPAGFAVALNQMGVTWLSLMPKDDPTTGPMPTQPVEHASTTPTQGLPMMPSVGSVKQAPKPEQKPTRAQAIGVAKARITRRNSLLIQRKTLKE